LDVYEQVITANPDLPPHSLVIEHGFLANKGQRARAIRLGIPVTVQHPLLYAMAGNLIRLWGPERAREIMPVRAWLDEGAQVSAGTDYPAASYEPMQAIWGMITRQTKDAGVQGPEYTIDPYTAFTLYTVAGAQLVGEQDHRGTLQPGMLADIVAFARDPLAIPVDDLPGLQPAFTLVGGRVTHDPQGRFGDPTP
jgi:predicted amidohydrolase YtcJ